MKTELTIEQSQHLIELGVPPPNSEISIHRPFPHHKLVDTYKVFKLEDLLKILPKEIEVIVLNKYQAEVKEKCRFSFEWVGYGYLVCYKTISVSPKFITKYITEELIDALYELTVWCIENGHLKFD